MGDGALFYYKDIVEKDEELIDNNQYEFINNEILNKDNILICEQNKHHKPSKQTKRSIKQKIKNVVSIM
jgi:hypothetical protein